MSECLEQDQQRLQQKRFTDNVVVICLTVAILIFTAVVAVNSYSEQKQRDAAMKAALSAHQAQDDFESQHGRYADSVEQLYAFRPSLQNLVQQANGQLQLTADRHSYSARVVFAGDSYFASEQKGRQESFYCQGEIDCVDGMWFLPLPENNTASAT